MLPVVDPMVMRLVLTRTVGHVGMWGGFVREDVFVRMWIREQVGP